MDKNLLHALHHHVKHALVQVDKRTGRLTLATRPSPPHPLARLLSTDEIAHHTAQRQAEQRAAEAARLAPHPLLARPPVVVPVPPPPPAAKKKRKR